MAGDLDPEFETDFDAQFADELELLTETTNDADIEFGASKPKSRRSLHFVTPAKPPSNHTTEYIGSLPASDSPGVPASAKRKAPDLDSPPALLIDDVPDLSLSASKPPEKRPRTKTSYRFEDDIEITTPSAQTPHAALGSGRIQSRIPDGDFVSVTGVCGDRVYVSVVDEAVLSTQIEATRHQCRSLSLLSVPYYRLKEQVLKQKDDALRESIMGLSASSSAADMETEGGVDRDVREVSGPVNNDNLWVEKYSPINYTELLSDEAVNRSLLQWIKLWDHVVFRKDLPAKPKEPKVKDNKKFVKKNEIEVLVELDKHRRPSQKVVLLCGPPGLGKTTLAHIIARHAGYKVIEMNASDDRTAESFRTTIESCTQMKAMLGRDPRPNCLVIDEIDGAPAAAINVLLSIVKYPEGATKQSKNTKILMRPIVCICNDIYVPALRELRKIALVLTFPHTAAPRLAARLYEVVGEERLRADMNSLLALCEKTDNDIRSCLNTLQFLQRHHSKITMRMIQQANVGQKDSHKTLFSVWHDIFTIPKVKRARLGTGMDEQDQQDDVSRWQQATTLGSRFDHILGVVHAAGDYHKVNQGLYENYLTAKSKDPHLTGLVVSTDWLCFIDHINQYIGTTQDYSPMKYIPYMAVTFHLIYGSNTYTKIQYPRSQFEHSTSLTKSCGLLDGLLSDMVPSVRKFFDTTTIVLDFLPSLLVIIQPTLRPVNTQLYSSREKGDLVHLVHVMIAYNLTYKQEKQVDAQYNYALEPNMDVLVKFEGQKVSYKPLTYAAKQLIAREVELEKLRRSEVAYGARATTNKTGVPTPPATPKAPPSHKAPRVDIVKENKPVRNFFGQIVKKDPVKAAKEENTKANILSTNVWFHFKEGFSNAVRRSVRVKDFL